MTEVKPVRRQHVEAAVFNGLMATLGDQGLHPSSEELVKMAVWVTRRALKAHEVERVRGEPVVELRAALHQLWEEAGEPSSRDLARRLGKSHMTWFTALRCDPVPAWGVFSELVRHLDGDPGKLEELWMRAKGKPPIF